MKHTTLLHTWNTLHCYIQTHNTLLYTNTLHCYIHETHYTATYKHYTATYKHYYIQTLHCYIQTLLHTNTTLLHTNTTLLNTNATLRLCSSNDGVITAALTLAGAPVGPDWASEASLKHRHVNDHRYVNDHRHTFTWMITVVNQPETRKYSSTADNTRHGYAPMADKGRWHRVHADRPTQSLVCHITGLRWNTKSTAWAHNYGQVTRPKLDQQHDQNTNTNNWQGNILHPSTHSYSYGYILHLNKHS